MAAPSPQSPNLDRYVVIHVATTCDEHGVYVTKDSAEVIELGWILLDAKSCEEVRLPALRPPRARPRPLTCRPSSIVKVSLSSLSTLPLPPFAVSSSPFGPLLR